MEMSNDYMPELHVAQQRRRDKLRVQQLEDLHHSNNFHHHITNNNSNNNSAMVYPSEMLNFTGLQSTTYASIHPSRFVAPSSSDSCDPQPLQGCDNWVSSYDDHGRRNLIMAHYSAHNNNNNNNNNHSSSNNNNSSEVLAAHYYHSGVNGWENGGIELPLLPSFVSQGANDASAHGLSLSLSSNQICEMHHLSEPRDLKPIIEHGSIISSVVKLDSGKSQIQDVGGSSNNHAYRNIGPLGPFTGYATILRGSKFLKPAQVMLDEFLTSAGLRHVRESDEVESVPNSIVLRSKFHGSSDLSSGSGSGESYRPDCNEKKAKLLHMQEEVCKRHKQYHQQMEMVMSAFESVPGLSNATPYISRSLKAISRHFRTLKNAISDQLKLIKRALGEDLSTPTSYMKGGDCSSRFDHNCKKAKTSVIGGASYGGQQNHIWRPQRGLPERAVSVLRAWLFDHFLHPYPTDSDKQMLASQTGLSRNQVSNWFINARVRLWKPMVEEIHMLETKGTTCSTPSSNHRQATVSHKPRCKPTVNAIDCLESSSYMEETRAVSHAESQLHQKSSRIESHQIPDSVDESFIGFLPYQRRGLELGGLGAVSLTLGLRHGSETASHQQQLQHQFQHQGMHFGGHVMHDFTG